MVESSIYKDASRRKLRFATNRGNLSVDQLWDLKDKEIETLIRAQYNLIKSSKTEEEELSFLSDTEVLHEDTDEKLRYQILEDIYKTKKAEREAKSNELEKKRYNEHIIELIQKKQDEELASLSIEELQKRLK